MLFSIQNMDVWDGEKSRKVLSLKVFIESLLKFFLNKILKLPTLHPLCIRYSFLYCNMQVYKSSTCIKGLRTSSAQELKLCQIMFGLKIRWVQPAPGGFQPFIRKYPSCPWWTLSSITHNIIGRYIHNYTFIFFNIL